MISLIFGSSTWMLIRGRWWRQAAERGDATSEYNLGNMYELGHGVPRDAAEAVRWFRSAAEQGYAVAQNGLGWMYHLGSGVAKDDVEAAGWFRKSAEQGNATAQLNLGRMYSKGLGGLPKDEVQAMYWKGRAAEQGNAGAYNSMAWTYATDSDLRDSKKAIEYAQMAIKLEKTAGFVDTLAEAYYSDNQLQRAVETEQQAISLAVNNEEKQLYAISLRKYHQALTLGRPLTKTELDQLAKSAAAESQ